jgi:multisubunit Na+/H+ antiporter MnhG subunit
MGFLAALVVALTAPIGFDYVADAQPAVDALSRWDLAAYAADQPQMGPLSILLRAPLVALAGPDAHLGYRLGALICLLAAVALAAALASHNRVRVSGIVLVAVLVLNPLPIRAVQLGHPEEPLCAALCIGALLLAADRNVLSGMLLGLALATKQWALLAVIPVVVAAAPGSRVKLAVIAGGVAAMLTLPGLIADPPAYLHAMERPAFGLGTMRKGSIWGVLVDQSVHVPVSGSSYRLVPVWLQAIAHPLILVVTIGGSLLLVRRRRVDPLALLALLFLLRCALDPWDHAYYHVPMVAALAAWETVRLRKAPVVAALSSAWLWVVFVELSPRIDVIADLLYLAWAVPLFVWLGRPAIGALQVDDREVAAPDRQLLGHDPAMAASRVGLQA